MALPAVTWWKWKYCVWVLQKFAVPDIWSDKDNFGLNLIKVVYLSYPLSTVLWLYSDQNNPGRFHFSKYCSRGRGNNNNNNTSALVNCYIYDGQIQQKKWWRPVMIISRTKEARIFFKMNGISLFILSLFIFSF